MEMEDLEFFFSNSKLSFYSSREKLQSLKMPQNQSPNLPFLANNDKLSPFLLFYLKPSNPSTLFSPSSSFFFQQQKNEGERKVRGAEIVRESKRVKRKNGVD